MLAQHSGSSFLSTVTNTSSEVDKRNTHAARVTLRTNAVEPVRGGHPWVWRESLVRSDTLLMGAVVELRDEAGVAIGSGIADPSSAIAVRVWTVAPERWDAGLVGDRVRKAIRARTKHFDNEKTTAYRCVAGEGDRLPAVTVDRYDMHAIVKLDGEAITEHRDVIRQALTTELPHIGIETITLRTGGRGAAIEFESWLGGLPPPRVIVLEHGVPMVVDLHEGQKTGAFLDQRENRKRVGELSRGCRVLNLFSYTGGFSLHAALGGASHVTSVDSAAKAHAAAQASFVAAGIEPKPHAFVTADAFQFLENAHRRSQKWDLIVCDPPSFAPNEKSVARALSAYRTLHAACARVLAKGGVFCASSCSSHVPADLFLTTLDDASLQRSDLHLVDFRGLPADHPTLPIWKEGRYLKFAVLE